MDSRPAGCITNGCSSFLGLSKTKIINTEIHWDFSGNRAIAPSANAKLAAKRQLSIA
jgi:hypothetical protein